MKDPLNKSEFLTMVDAAIEHLMSERSLSVTNVSDELNIHVHQLRRRLLTFTGKSTSDYITDYRLQRAKQMLLDHDMVTIQKIGFLLGFDEPTHFSRFFKHYVGMTPGEYRKSNGK